MYKLAISRTVRCTLVDQKPNLTATRGRISCITLSILKFYVAPNTQLQIVCNLKFNYLLGIVKMNLK